MSLWLQGFFVYLLKIFPDCDKINLNDLKVRSIQVFRPENNPGVD